MKTTFEPTATFSFSASFSGKDLQDAFSVIRGLSLEKGKSEGNLRKNGALSIPSFSRAERDAMTDKQRKALNICNAYIALQDLAKSALVTHAVTKGAEAEKKKVA